MSQAETLRIVNTLPITLRHYKDELLAVLDAAGITVAALDSQSVEMADDGESRAGRAAELLKLRAGSRADPEPAVVLWPALGFLDTLTWLGRAAPTWVIMHDPNPLRKQFAMGERAAKLGKLGLRSRVGVLVHSTPAAESLASRGWQSVNVPHPILRPGPTSPATGDRITVLGQWKPVRIMGPLEALAGGSRFAGRLDVAGRGWPDIPGWNVDSRFLSETELDDRIRASAAVLVPYRRYFQSNIAVRALEELTPVVGLRHPFLEEVFGHDWPGLVDGDDWAGALERAERVSRDRVETLRQSYWDRCVERWAGFMAEIGDPGATRTRRAR